MTCDSITVLITYDTPAPGVILYYVKQLEKKKSTAFAVYPSTAYNYADERRLCALGVGSAALATCIFDMGLSNRGLQTGQAY